eukprot:c24376_g1_i1 orf=485-1420(-)
MAARLCKNFLHPRPPLHFGRLLNRPFSCLPPLSSWFHLDSLSPCSGNDCRSFTSYESWLNGSCFSIGSNRFNLRTLTTKSSVHTEEVGKNDDTKDEEKQQTVDPEKQVLGAALAYVPKLGWSEAALVAGAKDLGLSPAIVAALSRKEAALVEFFMDECLGRLLDEIENREEELINMIVSDRIATLARLRLEMQGPFISQWAQALSIQANPVNFPTAFKQRTALMDEIWHAAGDRSSDIDWYTKRGILAGVYTATELYMLTDHSAGFRDTWVFLEKRIKDAINCRKTAQEATQFAQAVGVGLTNALDAFLKR